MDKDVVYAHGGILFNRKKEENPASMDGWNKSEKDRSPMVSLILESEGKGKVGLIEIESSKMVAMD